MQNRGDLDRVWVHAIDQAIRPFDQLTNVLAPNFGDDPARFGELARLLEPVRDALNELLGIDGRGQADVLGNGRQLGDGVLRPAERPHYEARRIRARMRASASSWLTTRPAAASVRPASIDWRT